MLNLTADQALEYQGTIELLLVTATDTETAALARVLEPLVGLADVALTHIENHTYRLGRFGAFPAVHLQCVMGTRAAGSATSATIEALRCWTPKAVVMPGIAWGSPRLKSAGLADVLVASTVQDFESARVGETYVFRSHESEAGIKLLDRFRSLTDWTFELPDGRRSARRLGLLLSGDKLIANAQFRDTLLDGFQRAIGGDMESHGVAQACRTVGVEWIVAKGICDWGDEKKDDTWQRTAAEASVSCCLAALCHPSALHGLGHALQPDAVQVAKYGDTNEPPNEVPVATERRIGRDGELATLIESLTAATNAMNLSIVVGMGGVGKTFLAADAARDSCAKGAFPDGVIWHQAYDQSPAQVMAHVVSALGGGASFDDLSALHAAYRRLLRDRHVLIVVDNALAASQVSALMTESPGSAVMVTSRNHMPSLRSRAAGLIDLGRMAPDDAIELLQYKSGMMPADQRTALGNIASLCGHLPLALSIAGSLLGDHAMWPTVESLARRLETSRLDCLTIEGCPDLDVRAVLLVSYEGMDTVIAEVFRALSLLGRSSFGASAVSYMLGQDKEATIRNLARLIGRSVLERSAHGRYVLHDLLRDLSAELVAKDEAPERVAMLRQRSAEYWEKWSLATSLGGVASGLARKGESDKAIEYFERAHLLNDELGDRQGLASSYGGIAGVWAKRGNGDKAIEYFDKAQVLNKEIGDIRGLAASLGGLAGAWAKKGNADKAIEHFDMSQALNRQVGNPQGLARSLAGIAAAWAMKGDAARAIEYYDEALALVETLGDRQELAPLLGGIGAAWAKKGNADRAMEYFERARALSKELGDQQGLAMSLGSIAAAWVKKGNLDEAIHHYEQAAAIQRDTGDRHGLASSLGGIAGAWSKKGNPDKAIEYYHEDRNLCEDIGDSHGLAMSLGGIAGAWAKKGNAEKAIEYYERAATIQRDNGYLYELGMSLGGIGGAWTKKGNTGKAIEYYEQAATIQRDRGDRRGLAMSLGGIAGALAKTGAAEQAIERYKEAAAIQRDIGDRYHLCMTLSGLARVARRVGKASLADNCAEEMDRLRCRQR